MPPVLRTRSTKPDAPPRNSPIARDLEGVEECGICLKPFDPFNHTVAHTRCDHVFGKECLDTWVKSKRKIDATCPTCRATLFDLPKPPVIIEDYQRNFGSSWLTPEEAHFVIGELWAQCLVLKHLPAIDGYELQFYIQRIHFALAQKYQVRSFLSEDDLFTMIELAKEMLKDMCENPEKKALTPQERREVWIPRLGELLEDPFDPDLDFTAASDCSE